jgi:hypothetical protein
MQKYDEINIQIKSLNTLLAHLSTQNTINEKVIYELCNKIKTLKINLKNLKK